MRTCILIAATVIIAAVICILIIAAAQGKRLAVHTNTELDGVDAEMEEILYYASLSPNSHNAQGWSIAIDPEEQQIHITVDTARQLTTVDSEGREAYISLGCYIETLVTAFGAYGYEAETALEANEGMITVSYEKVKDGAIDTDILELIQKRHTDKSKYNETALDTEVIPILTQGMDGVFFYEKDSFGFTYLKEHTIKAVREQSASQEYRDELNEWMRFSDSEVEQEKDGISAEMIGLTGITKSFYYWTTNHRNATGDKFAAQGISTAESQVNHCGAFFIITGDDTVSGWMEAGRITQRFWLRCAEHEIAMQPMSAILEVSPYAHQVQSDLDLDAPAQMILRVGYVDDYGENVGVRRNLCDYVSVDD